MKNKLVTGVFLTLLLASTLTLAFNIKPVKAEPTTWTVDDDGPADFHTVQEAINAANPGDAVLVASGTYYEHLVVNKSVSLVGEDKETTIIDGNMSGTVVDVKASDVLISNFTIRNSIYTAWYSGVKVEMDNCTITNNIITNNWFGVYFGYYPGQQPRHSSDNILCGNNIKDNRVGIYLLGCENSTIIENNIINSYCGVFFFSGSDNQIYHNNFIENFKQVALPELMAGSTFSILSYIYDDLFCVSYPSGGNYWSDYDGTDLLSGPYQNETGSDGIGDAPYTIYAMLPDNYPNPTLVIIDSYPLMNPWTPPPDIYVYDGLPVLPVACLLYALPPCIYDNIITYVNENLSIMCYNISTKKLTETELLLFHSLYGNLLIAAPQYKSSLALYDISTGIIKYLPYPYRFDGYDLFIWAKVWPGRVISMHGDIIALIDADGVWAYNITTESIMINLTTEYLDHMAGISVYENIIAFSDGFIWYHDLSTNITTNTTVPGGCPSVYGDIIAFQLGSTIKYYNISSGQETTAGTGEVPSIHGNIIVFSTSETSVGEDLNADGDMEDMVIRYYDMLTHTVTNTRKIGEYPSIYGKTIAFSIYEPMVDTDLNHDGDKDDYVITYTSPDTAVINVTTNTTFAVQGDQVSINATVENQGILPENINVTAYADLNTTIIGDEITIGIQSVTLTSGNSTTVTFTWNTTGVNEGDYTISAKASVVPGETDTTDNTKADGTVAVLYPRHDVAVVSKTPFARPKDYPNVALVLYEAYSDNKTTIWKVPLQINVTVKNNGTFTETFSVTLYWNTTNVIGTKTVTLAFRETKNVTFTWAVPSIPFAWPYPIYILNANVSLAGDMNPANNLLTDGAITVKWPGDCNGDGKVDGNDLYIMAMSWHSSVGDPRYDPRADLNMDGNVNGFDLYAMAKNWKKGPLN